jgi:hypothetical protein
MNQDSFCENLLRSANKKEALVWVTEAQGIADRTLGEMDVPASLAVIRELYGMGADEVTAVEIQAAGCGETSDILIVTLPAEKQKREALFAWEEEHAESNGFDPVKDEGQRYLFLLWD